MKTNNFDPLAYIENAFLDSERRAEEVPEQVVEKELIPETAADGTESTMDAFLNGVPARGRFRKTVMSAPRPRRSKKSTPAAETTIDPELQQIWQALPKSVEFLCQYYDDEVTRNYYGDFRESRQQLIRRLLDPVLTLEETSRLLGVCPATVRRYTNRGWLTCHRTEKGQRRFRLSDIVKFVDEHGRFPEA